MTFSGLSSGSYAQQHAEEVRRRAISNLPYERSLQRNDQQRAIDAQNAGKDWELLAKLTQTGTKLLYDQVKKKNERDYLEGLNEATFDESVLDQQNKDINELEEDILEVSDIAKKAADNGEDYEVVEKIQSTSGWKEYGLAVGKAKLAAEAFPAYLDTMMASDNTTKIRIGDEVFTPSTAETLNQKQAAIRELRNKFIIDSGFYGWDKDFINKNLLTQMRKDEGLLVGKYRKIHAIDQSAATRELAFLKFESDNNLTALFASIIPTQDAEGKWLTNDGAWKLIDAHIKKRAEAGTITQDDLKVILSGDSHIPGKTWGEAFGKTRAKEWEELIDNEATKNIDDAIKNKKIKGKQFELDFITRTEEKYAKGEYWTDAELKEEGRKWTRITGQDPDQADFIQNIYTRQESDDDNARDTLDSLRKDRGYLIKSDLDPYSPGIYKEYISLVQDDKPLAEADQKAIDDQLPQIHGYAFKAIKSNAEERFGTEYQQMIKNSSDAYRKLVYKYLREKNPLEGKDGALLLAQKDIEIMFDLNGDVPGAKFLNENYFGPIDRNANNQFQLDVQETEEWLDDPDDNVVPESISKKYLEEAIAFRDGKVMKVPEFFKRATQNYNMTAHQLMDRILKGAGEKTIAESKTRVSKVVNEVDTLNRVLPSSMNQNFSNPSHETNAQICLEIDSMNTEEGICNSPYYVIPGLEQLEVK